MDFMTSNVDRALVDGFIPQLAAEAAKGGWWADALADPKLFIALRGSYLNVYWRGQSLFYVEARQSGLKVTTHQKYLVDPALASQVPLINGAFDVASLENGLIRRYAGPATLVKMKSAAGLFSGLEKTGCHEIAVHNPSVIDCEIAFPGPVSPGVVKTCPSVTRSTFTGTICHTTAELSRKITQVSSRTWWRSRKWVNSTPLIRGGTPIVSNRCPGTSAKRTRLPSASVRARILVVMSPLERPMA
jgi:hypothetical protein